jgi:hypothetical protein
MTDTPTGETEKKETSPHDAAVVGLLVLGIFGAIAFIAWFFTDRFEIHSECKDISGGMSCAITHTSKKPQSLSVCVNIKRVCSNGLASNANACFNGLVAPETSGILVVASSEFSNAQNCPRVTAQTESLEVQEKQKSSGGGQN